MASTQSRMAPVLELPPVPRRMALKRGRGMLRVGQYTGFLALLGIACFFAWMARDAVTVLVQGRTVDATIVRNWRDRGPRGYQYQYICYEFSQRGMVEGGVAVVSPEDAAELPVGAHVPVRAFQRDGLWESALYMSPIGAWWHKMPVLVPSFLVDSALTVWVFVIVKGWRRRRWLVRYGATAVGKVLEQITRRNKGGGYVYFIEYEFKTAAGRWAHGRMRVAQGDFHRTEIDQEIMVLYDADRPEVNLVYSYGEHIVVGSDLGPRA